MTATHPPPIRIFHLQPGASAVELDALPQSPPPLGFYWVACARSAFEARQAQLQAMLHCVTGLQLVDLHIADLTSTQLPSHYDYTSQYDLLVMRRLSASTPGIVAEAPITTRLRGGPPVLRRIDTSPVGFALFDSLLLSVHPEDCSVRDSYAERLTAPPPVAPQPPSPAPSETPAEATLCQLHLVPSVAGVRLPTGSADLMLRLVNHIVDNYLDLRRDLSSQLDHWQAVLLEPRGRFTHWRGLLAARLVLHQLHEICEDQRSAVQAWNSALEVSGAAAPVAQRELELLKVRSRDVLEHISRVVHHVRRLEQSTEAAVQMHFSLQSNRTNDIMRVLTVLTAVFLPLNLIAGIFGMNFEYLPFVETTNGFWWALLAMLAIAASLTGYFWRKRYLVRTGRA